MKFAEFDTRGYRTVDVRTGYAEWVPTYEDTVQDAMDIALLDELRSVEWTGRAADLGCGTGRTAAWLRAHGVERIDGVDLTPEMLDVARERGAHDTLREGDVADTGLGLGRVRPRRRLAGGRAPADADAALRRGAAARPGQAAPSCSSASTRTSSWPRACRPTSPAPPASRLAIATHVHLLSDHVATGLAAGWTLAEMREGVIDDRWIAVKPKVGEVPPPPDLGGLRVAQPA